MPDTLTERIRNGSGEDRELAEWGRAAALAALAMGSYKVRSGRKMETHLTASDDPLAWWSLTEAIMGFRFRALAAKEQRT